MGKALKLFSSFLPVVLANTIAYGKKTLYLTVNSPSKHTLELPAESVRLHSVTLDELFLLMEPKATNSAG